MKQKERKKIRFPVARIKRIMQSDEDIGKITMTAPVVLGKAMELFITDLVKETNNSVDITKCNRLKIIDLKKVIENSPKFDFLKNIVKKYEKSK